MPALIIILIIVVVALVLAVQALAAVYVGLWYLGFVSTLLVESSWSFRGVVSPIAAWAALGFLLGASIGLWRGAAKGKAPYLKIYAFAIPLAMVTVLALGPSRHPRLAADFAASIAAALRGTDWAGRVGGLKATLHLDSVPPLGKSGPRLAGTIRVGDVEERLSVEMKTDGTIVLVGVGYRRLPRKESLRRRTSRGKVCFDEFRGWLSAGRDGISGTYSGACGGTGPWSVSRSAPVQAPTRQQRSSPRQDTRPSRQESTATAPEAPVPVAQNVEGTYDLYDVGKPSVGVVNRMTIYNQSGSSFSILGDGWMGTGWVSGGNGYYDWRFSDGRRGRTTISVRSDGTIDGRVQGPGDKELNWSYIAKPMSRP
jgi:hypothetical protein